MSSDDEKLVLSFSQFNNFYIFEKKMVETIIYIALFILSIYIIAVLLDYIKANNLIKKRKDSYFSLSDFMSIIKMSPFNQEERFNTYIKVVDPVSKLVLESIGFDPNIIKTYKDDDSIAKYMNEYVMGDKVNIKLEKKDMINYLNSEEFDIFTNWSIFPSLILPFVLDTPIYDEKNPLKSEDIIKIQELLKDEAIRKKIISSKAFINHLHNLINATEKVKEENKDDENSKEYLGNHIKRYTIVLQSAEIYLNSEKKRIMGQY